MSSKDLIILEKIKGINQIPLGRRVHELKTHSKLKLTKPPNDTRTQLAINNGKKFPYATTSELEVPDSYEGFELKKYNEKTERFDYNLLACDYRFSKNEECELPPKQFKNASQIDKIRIHGYKFIDDRMLYYQTLVGDAELDIKSEDREIILGYYAEDSEEFRKEIKEVMTESQLQVINKVQEELDGDYIWRYKPEVRVEKIESYARRNVVTIPSSEREAGEEGIAKMPLVGSHQIKPLTTTNFKKKEYANKLAQVAEILVSRCSAKTRPFEALKDAIMKTRINNKEMISLMLGDHSTPELTICQAAVGNPISKVITTGWGRFCVNKAAEQLIEKQLYSGTKIIKFNNIPYDDEELWIEVIGLGRALVKHNATSCYIEVAENDDTEKIIRLIHFVHAWRGDLKVTHGNMSINPEIRSKKRLFEGIIEGRYKQDINIKTVKLHGFGPNGVGPVSYENVKLRNADWEPSSSKAYVQLHQTSKLYHMLFNGKTLRIPFKGDTSDIVPAEVTIPMEIVKIKSNIAYLSYFAGMVTTGGIETLLAGGREGTDTAKDLAEFASPPAGKMKYVLMCRKDYVTRFIGLPHFASTIEPEKPKMDEEWSCRTASMTFTYKGMILTSRNVWLKDHNLVVKLPEGNRTIPLVHNYAVEFAPTYMSTTRTRFGGMPCSVIRSHLARNVIHDSANRKRKAASSMADDFDVVLSKVGKFL